MDYSRLHDLFRDLTGQKAPFQAPADGSRHLDAFIQGDAPLGYSQLNELLLLYGYDRITRAFFQYLVDGTSSYTSGSSIGSIDHLAASVDRFQQLALLLFGNVKYAFKQLSRSRAELDAWLEATRPVSESELQQRHAPVLPIEKIPGNETYLLGYVIERDLKRALEEKPGDERLQELEQKRLRVVVAGKRNHNAYLASDHLDVYVATSMREQHEYLLMSRYTTEIFQHPKLTPLKLRWFDPTQAYCSDRIDKGLSEALMLKRAKCTVYFAQESDTFGKDSELAATLAQGKVVIAFVPEGGNEYVENLLTQLADLDPRRSEVDLIMDQLRMFEPSAAWNDPQVQGWLQDRQTVNFEAARKRLCDVVEAHYDKRADLLRKTHPLGIQVNLESGVANGVLVVRTIDDCAELIRRAVLRNLRFHIKTSPAGYTFLVEDVSGCTYRVVTGDAMLTNTFWNFYLDPSE